MFTSKMHSLWRPAALCLVSSSLCLPGLSRAEFDPECQVNFEPNEKLLNWSSTHSSTVSKVYEPQNDIEVMRLLRHHSKLKAKLRPIGTALSPNGLGMPDNGTNGVTLRLLSDIRVNAAQRTVTAGAGATVSDVLKELSLHGLTLENFSSIQEQQLGGWTQVAAHGTGISLPTVEEQIVEMKVITPAHGAITLSPSKNSALFKMAKVGLGSLGIVSEVTLKCIPQHQLREVTTVINRKAFADPTGIEGHFDRLLSNRHVRYMWIPYTDAVVSVTSKKVDVAAANKTSQNSSVDKRTEDVSPNAKMVSLLQKSANMRGGNSLKDIGDIKSHSVASLRDMLLEFGPLDPSHIRDINMAEAEYWRGSQTVRVDDSVNVLGFDCGGEQWVLETCIPLGHLKPDNNTDVEFVKDLLDVIEKEKLPAASPIEQRWTARSTAAMSPAYSADPDDKFCWVGVIMYVPANLDNEGREDVRREFVKYCQAIDPVLQKYNAVVHWAKIELPDPRDASSSDELAKKLEGMKSRLREKYPVEEFSALKKVLDPEGILSNNIVDSLFD